MKYPTLSLLAAFLLMGSFLPAQTTATWRGGKPGHPTDWNCAANWREGRTPDESSQVIIPFNAVCYPVLKNGVEHIDALLLEGGAELFLNKGAKLTILCETERFDGITLIGKITNEGSIEICKMPSPNASLLQRIAGNGSVTGLDSCGIASMK